MIFSFCFVFCVVFVHVLFLGGVIFCFLVSCELSTPHRGRARDHAEQGAVIPPSSSEFKSAEIVKALPPAIVPTFQW